MKIYAQSTVSQTKLPYYHLAYLAAQTVQKIPSVVGYLIILLVTAVITRKILNHFTWDWAEWKQQLIKWVSIAILLFIAIAVFIYGFKEF